MDFNLLDSGEACIGFRGEFDDVITNLAFYKARVINERPRQQEVVRLASLENHESEEVEWEEHWDEDQGEQPV